MGNRLNIVVVLLLSAAGIARGESLRLDIPIGCEIGRDCFIQNYFDHDPGPGKADYRCGPLTFDGHYGTDFRLRDLPAMEGRVAVLAAAPGLVGAVRDSEPDMNVRERGKEALQGKDAGNGVRISHQGGWETQYSHLLRGSIRVRPGQRVKQGEILGFVGLSGNTEFPHVHFTVRKDGRQVDPFAPEQTACGAGAEPLWSEAALPALRYIPTGVLIAGFADRVATRKEAEAGQLSGETFSNTAQRLEFWVELFGVRKDDQLSIELTGPDGERLLLRRQKIPVNMAVLLFHAGRQRGTPLWQTGRYRALFRLQRDGKTELEEQREMTVR